MKRSPTSSSSCSSSSSSSCVGSDVLLPDQTEKPKIKRPRKNQTKEKSTHLNNITNDSNSISNNNNNNTNSPNSTGRRSSVYRGVTRHRWTGRFEAHLWDKSSWNNIQNKKGRQVYLGAYDCEEAAARTYDLAALKYWGPQTTLNFPIENYEKEVEEMQKVSKEEYLASLRRRSSGFSRGVSKYRGVARHHHNGRWEARIGRVFGNKYLYLGTYNTQEEAAAAYDMAAIEYRGPNAVTNFDISHYMDRLKKKGILPFDRNQDPLPSSYNESEETEVEQPQPQPQTEQQQQQPQPQPALLTQEEQETISPQVQSTQLPQCMETASAVMVTDHPHPGDEHELTWSFCLDSAVGLTPLPVTDILLGNAGELPDFFHNMGFEDNIDFLFDTELEASNNNNIVENSTSCEVLGNMEDGEKLVVSRVLSESSNSSPSSSTTTSVSCNYCV